MIRLRPSGADEVLIKRVRDWYEPGPGVFIAPQALFNPALLFTTGVNGAWYDPSDINLTWRRNLLTKTEQFDDAVWSKFRSTVSVNAAVAPDGTMSSDKIVATNVLGSHGLGQAVGALPTTVSVYLKAGEYSFAAIGFNNVTPSVLTDSVFNITTGQIVSIGSDVASYSVTDVGNGWFRYSCQPSATATFSQMRVAVMADSTTISYTGDGTSGIYIWGAQLEVGSTATPYQRITDGVQDYLQYQAQPVLYQDAAGTTPVTAVEQPVGLMLDKSKGLVLGPELVTNGTFDTDSGWAKGAGWTISGGAANASAASSDIYQSNVALADTTKAYVVEIVISNYVSGTVRVALLGRNGGFVSGDGKKTFIAAAGGNTDRFLYITGSSFTGSIDNISVRELPGNHAFNSSGNSANFPVLKEDETGRKYLSFNGTNQWLQINSIDFTYGDKMFVCAGVRKLSDAARGMLVELGNGAANTNQFQLNAPLTDATTSYGFQSLGNVSTGPANATGYASPITNVVSGVGEISTDTKLLRVNGTQAASSTADQGTGNYGNYPLYLGARAGSSLWFNGRLHQLVVAGKEASASEIGQTEAFTNQKTGAY